MGGAGEVGEQRWVADGDGVLPEGVLGTLQAVQASTVSAELQQLQNDRGE